ncbi:VanZ family protein [Egicoccus sp. AB-alg2]|uniref:VanZ family protein n=1 Tax=Egicoccus sp. AB-alg2 TaxID=3242693 RepID=UPI00359CF611
MFGPIDVVAAASAALPVGVLVGVLVWRRRRAAHRATSDAWIDGAIVGWLVAVAVATLTPLDAFLEVGGRPDVVLTPFERLHGAPVAYAVVNTLLLAPLGFLFVLRGRRPRYLAAVAGGASVSLIIEVLQLLHPERGTNVDDLILNTAGVVVGGLLGAMARPLRPSRRRAVGSRRDRRGREPMGTG